MMEGKAGMKSSKAPSGVKPASIMCTIIIKLTKYTS